MFKWYGQGSPTRRTLTGRRRCSGPECPQQTPQSNTDVWIKYDGVVEADRLPSMPPRMTFPRRQAPDGLENADDHVLDDGEDALVPVVDDDQAAEVQEVQVQAEVPGGEGQGRGEPEVGVHDGALVGGGHVHVQAVAGRPAAPWRIRKRRGVLPDSLIQTWLAGFGKIFPKLNVVQIDNTGISTNEGTASFSSNWAANSNTGFGVKRKTEESVAKDRK